ncbi:hypothetical protein PS645_05354 [Pseudomonas fluorescens]|uniref:Uncharacterized protein n=1 Tax=Pseudomonas fluorescens TaxID=294 RepID=A0A5E6XFE8_PSEFL|nr:hypothetical protein PS645_05354 [Pseudomonas fluorescens]
MAALAAGPLQLVEQQLQRVIGMVHRRQGLAAQLVEKVDHPLVRIKAYAVHLTADKEPDQCLGVAAIAVGVGHTDGEVVLVAVAPEQQLPGCQRHHERRQPLALAEGIQAGDQTRREGPLMTPGQVLLVG